MREHNLLYQPESTQIHSARNVRFLMFFQKLQDLSKLVHLWGIAQLQAAAASECAGSVGFSKSAACGFLAWNLMHETC